MASTKRTKRTELMKQIMASMVDTDKIALMGQIRANENQPGLPELLRKYVGQLHITTYEPFCTWAEALGFQRGDISFFDSKHKMIDLSYNLRSKHKMINLAYNLRGQYDLGVGIATSGLEPAYFFSLFGLEVLVCECHEGRGFRWAGEPSREYLRGLIKGKRVTVIDEDLVDGHNSRRAVNEILKYRPQQADLTLVCPFWNGPISRGSHIYKNASPKFGRVVTSADFGYKEFDKAIRIVEQAVSHSTGAEARLQNS